MGEDKMEQAAEKDAKIWDPNHQKGILRRFGK